MNQLQQDKADRQALADLREREAAGIEPPVKCRTISFASKRPVAKESEPDNDRLVEL